jgi:hypothetical protein
MDPAFDNGVPALCKGTLNGDTLQIQISIGFFGGYAFFLTIYAHQFNFLYSPVADQKIYKVR